MSREDPHAIAQTLWDQHPTAISKNPDPSDVILALEAAGYHLIHEDDVPSGSPTSPPVTKRWSEADFALDAGWRACRDLIFGEDKP